MLEERDIIKRKVIEGTLLEKKTFIEVYPLEVKVYFFFYLIKKKNKLLTKYKSIALIFIIIIF